MKTLMVLNSFSGPKETFLKDVYFFVIFQLPFIGKGVVEIELRLQEILIISGAFFAKVSGSLTIQ
jgi:hypothetical protein